MIASMCRRAFSLIELLTVIAILALLMGLLAPGLRASKQRAQEVVCQSNLRQIGLSLALYESAQGRFPRAYDGLAASPPGGFLGSGAAHRSGAWWINYLIADSSEVLEPFESPYWCPSRKVNLKWWEDSVLVSNYGVNASICRLTQGTFFDRACSGAPLSTSRVTSPGRSMLIFDSGYAFLTWHYSKPGMPDLYGDVIDMYTFVPGACVNQDSDRQIWPGQEDDAIDGRHPNHTVNIGFVDGHVENQAADDLLVTEENGRYDNRSPRWIP